MNVVVHHQNVGVLVAVLPDDDRAGFKPDGLCTVVAPVACYDLIAAAIAGADDQRLGNTHALNAVHELREVLRGAVNGVRLTRVGENLVSGDDLHSLLCVCLPLLIRLEQVIERGQTDVF